MSSRPGGGISRRGFLYGVGASLAAPYVAPGMAMAARDDSSPNDRIQIGLVGCGGQGRGVMENAIRHRGTRVVAVCDVDQTRLAEAKRLVDEFNEDTACATYADYREVLARDDVDVVIVATPDHWHAIICVEAAKRGKDIYCEKPMTWSLGEGRAVVKAVQENSRVFQVGSMQRSGNQFKQACELVRNGYLGNVHHILVSLPDYGNAIWVDEFPKPPEELDWEFYVGPAEWAPFHPKRYHWDWRWWMGFGGGQMMDWVGHHGDIAHMAMDWDNTGPVEVEGVLWEPVTERNNLYDAPAQYQFECKYANGTTMTVVNASRMPEIFKSNATGGLGTMFFGENDQWLYVDRSGINASAPELLKIRSRDMKFQFRRGLNHVTDFLDCVKSREECIAPVNAGHRSASIGHLGKIVCMLGAKFQWDPENEVFVDNPALNGLLMPRYRGDWKLEA